MKSVFDDLAEWLLIRQDSYWYEGHDGQQCFDYLAMKAEIDAFSEAMEKQIH